MEAVRWHLELGVRIRRQRFGAVNAHLFGQIAKVAFKFSGRIGLPNAR